MTPAIISERLWIQHFSRAPTAAARLLSRTERSPDGAVIRVRQVPLTIVGVAPGSFQGLYLPRLVRTDLWVPLAISSAIQTPPSLVGRPRRLQLRGRLNTGLTIDQARARILAFSAQVQQFTPGSIERGERLTLVTGELSQSLDRTLSPLGGALLVLVGLVLLIAAANASTMIVSRGAARHSEIAVRTSLGASELC